MSFIDPPEVEVEFCVGTDITEAIKEAQEHSISTGQKVRFDFNGIKFCISKDTIRLDAIEEYHRRLRPITGE